MIFIIEREPAEVAFRDFAEVIHSAVPDLHSVDLHRPETQKARGICGDHGRVAPTRQGLCPLCAGYLHDAENIEAMRTLARLLPR